MSNPYDPQSPAKPDYFGGRKQILQIVEERMGKAKEQEQSGGILIYGHRGVGKTSLLKKIINLADPENKGQNIVAVYRRLPKTTSDSELYQIIAESVLEEINNKKNLFEKIYAIKGSLNSAKVLGLE